ncbi:MAG: sensor domain-containing diguanylate cyclase [Gemmatimonadaceae bacterium]|nr:sensor domain-containing diguanylate cyclase [Gemmatimonadaceae bacterium]
MLHDPSSRSSRFILLGATWSLALVVIAFDLASGVAGLRGGARAVVDGIGAVLTSLALALLLRERVEESVRKGVGLVAAFAAPLVAIYATESGGVHSAPFVAAGVCVVGSIVALGARGTWIGAASLLIVTILGPTLRGAVVPPADIVHGIVVVAAVAVLPSLYILRSTERQTVRMLAELPSFGVTGIAPVPADEPPAVLLRDREAHDERLQVLALGRFLRQVRDTLGASDAVFWRAAVPGGTLTPFSCALGEPRRHRDDLRLGRDLAPVLAADTVALFDRAPGMVAAVVVPGAAEPMGVLTLHEPRAAIGPDVLSRWLPRFSENLGVLAGLLETQAEYARQSRQASAVLDASQAFQGQRDEAGLGQAIVESAVKVSGAPRAALVRWHDESETGVVTHVTAGHHLAPATAIGAEALVAQLCRTGLPQVWEDARTVEQSLPVYGAAHRLPSGVESLAVIPLRHGTRTTGALVVEGDRVGEVPVREVRNLRLFATLAAENLETVRLIAQATRRAATDALTGLLNRGAFDDALRREIAEADRYGRSVGLIVCDVDHFKRVNDLFGHDAGDEVLKAVATSLVAGVRDVDLVARYGGEELVLLLVQSDLAHTWEVADRLRAAIEARTIPVGDRLLRVTASFGVAAYPETAHLGDELFPAADRALYEAKREGRNCVRFARPLQPQAEETDDGGDGGWVAPPDGGPPL